MTSTYGLKQAPQTIHLLQNNTREVCGAHDSETLVYWRLSIFHYTEHVTRICYGNVAVLQWAIARLLDAGQSESTSATGLQQSTFKQHTKS